MLNTRSDISKKVLNYFLLQEGAETYINELARILKLESGNLTRKLLELEKEGVLKNRWQGKQRYYSLNTNFPLLKEYKAIILKTVGLEQVLRSSLEGIPHIKSAFIFGSYAQGQMDAHSDIDLFVVGSHSTVELQKAIAGVQKRIQREINVISVSSDEYKKRMKNDSLIKSIEQKKKIKLI